jgi:hypothetical protein
MQLPLLLNILFAILPNTALIAHLFSAVHESTCARKTRPKKSAKMAPAKSSKHVSISSIYKNKTSSSHVSKAVKQARSKKHIRQAEHPLALDFKGQLGSISTPSQNC